MGRSIPTFRHQRRSPVFDKNPHQESIRLVHLLFQDRIRQLMGAVTHCTSGQPSSTQAHAAPGVADYHLGILWMSLSETAHQHLFPTHQT